MGDMGFVKKSAKQKEKVSKKHQNKFGFFTTPKAYKIPTKKAQGLNNFQYFSVLISEFLN